MPKETLEHVLETRKLIKGWREGKEDKRRKGGKTECG